MRAWYLVFILLTLKADETEYKFYKNFGEIFHDYSGKNRDGINGVVIGKDKRDTLATDRGAYFDKMSCILIPSDRVSPISVIIWIKITGDAAEGHIYSRTSAKTFDLISKVDSSITFEFTIGTKTLKIGSIPKSKLHLGIWNLVIISTNFNMFSLCVADYDCKHSPEHISENEKFYSALGSDENKENSFIGFIYRFLIKDKLMIQDQKFEDEGERTIFGSPCSKQKISFEDSNEIYCLPDGNSTKYDSFSTECKNYPTLSCIKSTDLDCSCIHHTCVFNTTSILCYCENSVKSTSNDCVCDVSGEIYHEGKCEKSGSCEAACKICDSSKVCKTCNDPNSSPDVKGVCKCIEGFTKALDSKSYPTCVKCHETCLACNIDKSCVTCRNSSHSVSTFDNTLCNSCKDSCTCEEGSYFDETLQECKSCDRSCATCSFSYSCDTCALPFMVLQHHSFCSCEENEELNSNHSACVCKKGFVKQENDSCVNCSDNCLECKANNVSFCLKCFDNFDIVDGTCLCGLGKAIVNGNCTECVKNCKICKNVESCLECNPGFSLTTSGQCERACGKGFYLFNGSCSTCGSLCEICNATECLNCTKNADIKKGTCECKLGYEEEKMCARRLFSADFLYSEDFLVLIFQKELKTELNESHFNLSFHPNVRIKYEVFKEKQKYLFSITPQESIQKGIKAFLQIDKNLDVVSLDNSLLSVYNFSLELHQYSMPYQTSTSTAKVTNSTKHVVRGAIASSILVGLLSNPACFWVLMNTLEMISFLPLGGLGYSDTLIDFFTSFGSLNLIPNPVTRFVKLDSNFVPYQNAKDFGFETSHFHVNAGSYLFNLGFFILIIPLLLIGKRACRNSIKNRCINWLGNYRYNFFLRFWLQSYLTLVILAAIQLKSDFNSDPWSVISLCLSLVILVLSNQFIAVLTPGLTAFIGYFCKQKIQENDATFFQRYGSLFEEFKNNRGFLSNQFYSFFLFRRLVFAFSLVFLSDFLYVQQSLNLFGSLLSIGFFTWFFPFKEKLIGFSSYLGEICTLEVMIVSMFYLSNPNHETISQLENAIVYCIMGTIAIQTLVSVILMVQSIKELCLKLQRARARQFLTAAAVMPVDTKQGIYIETVARTPE